MGTEITVVVGTVCAFDDICSHENDSYVYICMPQDILTVSLEDDNWSLTVGSNHSLMPHVYYIILPISTVTIGQYSASITGGMDCISIMS